MQLALAGLLVLVGAIECQNFPMGDPVEQAWIINDSAIPLVVVVEEIGGTLVAPGARGAIYSEGGRRGFNVAVLSSDCTLLAETTNSRQLLLITVQPDRTVTFEQGANLSPLEPTGSITDTTDCV